MSKRKYVMRHAEPKDMPALIKLHKAQNRRDGTNYPLPRIFCGDGTFDKNIAMALVIEREGVVVQGIYFQCRILEMCFAGCDPRATRRVQEEIEAVTWTLRCLDYDGIRTMVPLTAPLERIQALLEEADFTRDDDKLASFFREI